jgi:hypothetical protein
VFNFLKLENKFGGHQMTTAYCHYKSEKYYSLNFIPPPLKKILKIEQCLYQQHPLSNRTIM